jgi:hypothetical protein
VAEPGDTGGHTVQLALQVPQPPAVVERAVRRDVRAGLLPVAGEQPELGVLGGGLPVAVRPGPAGRESADDARPGAGAGGRLLLRDVGDRPHPDPAEVTARRAAREPEDVRVRTGAAPRLDGRLPAQRRPGLELEVLRRVPVQGDDRGGRPGTADRAGAAGTAQVGRADLAGRVQRLRDRLAGLDLAVPSAGRRALPADLRTRAPETRQRRSGRRVAGLQHPGVTADLLGRADDAGHRGPLVGPLVPTGRRGVRPAGEHRVQHRLGLGPVLLRQERDVQQPVQRHRRAIRRVLPCRPGDRVADHRDRFCEHPRRAHLLRRPLSQPCGDLIHLVPGQGVPRVVQPDATVPQR